jgi:hypothetical protein
MKPCIRGLREFKKGCPENNLCQAWIETLGRMQPKIIKKCVDLVMVDLLWDMNCNTIGVQAATESFRNGMCEVSPDGKTVRPKINQLVINADRFIQEQPQLKRIQSAEL